MNAYSTAAALTALVAATAAFAAPTQEQPSLKGRSNPAPSSYQYENSAVSRPDSEAGANSDSASCKLQREVEKSAASTAFAATAAQDGVVEVALAGLAFRKSRNDEVRQLAQKMVEDYAQSNDRLESLVKCERLLLPTELDSQHNASIQTFDAQSGSAFDTAYLKHIGDKHSKAVALFESASRSGDPEVAAFARKGLSMLQEHQELANDLRVARGPTVANAR